MLGVAGTHRVTVQPVLPAAPGVCALRGSAGAGAARPREQLSAGNRPPGAGGKALETLASPLPEEPAGTSAGGWWLLHLSASMCSCSKCPSLAAEVRPPC